MTRADFRACGLRLGPAHRRLVELRLVLRVDLPDVNVQGGGTRSSYFISGGLLDHKGSIQPNDETRGNVRLNLDFSPTDKWTIDSHSAFTRNQVDLLQTGNNWSALGSGMSIF